MKVTKKQLKRIIQEELRRNIYENLATNPLEGKTTITRGDVNAALEDLRARLGPDFEEAMAEAEAQLPDYLKGSSLQEADPVTTSMGIISLAVMIMYMYNYIRIDDDPSDSGISDPKYARRDVPPSGE